MYRTAIVREEKYEDVTGLVILSKQVSQTSYNRSISFSDKADTVGGVTVLVEPTTKTFTTPGGLTELNGKYIDLNGAIYYIPTDTVFARYDTGGIGSVATVNTIQASKARRMYVMGFRLFSGVSEKNAVKKVNITAASNNGDDLMIGSVCSSCLNATIISTEGDFKTYEGDELTVYKVTSEGVETQIGVFNVTDARWISRRTYKITAYDNVIKLDRDITGWLRGLTEWPYALTEFFGMLATECGVEYYPVGDGSSAWNGSSSFMVHRFDVSDGTTGRQLMGAICEVMGDYCIAQPDGKLTANWYRVGYIKLYPTAKAVESGNEYEQHWLQNSLSYGDFNVQDVGYVQIREEQSEDAALWPDYGTDADVSNAYIITGNPILMAHPTYLGTSTVADSVRNALTNIASRFDYTQYRPFKVTIPELPMARAGMYVQFFENENSIYPTFIAPITSMKWSGHKMTLECTAKRTREKDPTKDLSNRQMLDQSSDTSAKQVEEATSSAAPVTAPVQRVVDAGRRPRAMVSFSDDDCRKEVYENIIDGVDHGLFKLIKDTGIPYILACPPGNIGNNDYMTKSQLLEMHRAGVEISCHTWKESNMTEYASAEALDDDLSDCMAMYRQWGIKGVEAYAYCQGVYEDDYMGAVKNHFRIGFTVTKGINQIPYESYYMKRVEVFPKDGSNSLDDVKAYVDQVAREGGWLILMTHAW